MTMKNSVKESHVSLSHIPLLYFRTHLSVNGCCSLVPVTIYIVYIFMSIYCTSTVGSKSIISFSHSIECELNMN